MAASPSSPKAKELTFGFLDGFSISVAILAQRKLLISKESLRSWRPQILTMLSSIGSAAMLSWYEETTPYPFKVDQSFAGSVRHFLWNCHHLCYYPDIHPFPSLESSPRRRLLIPCCSDIQSDCRRTPFRFLCSPAYGSISCEGRSKSQKGVYSTIRDSAYSRRIERSIRMVHDFLHQIVFSFLFSDSPG